MFVSNKDIWELNISNSLGSDFIKLANNSENAMHIIIFMHKSISNFVNSIEIGKVSTGVAGIIFNKGALSIGFRI